MLPASPTPRRRRALRVALAVLALALVAGGLWYWDATRFPADEQPIPGTRVTLLVQDGAEADAVRVRAGIEAGLRWLEAEAGRPLAGVVEARVARGDPCEPFLDPGGGGTGMADDGWLCVDTLVPVWRTLDADEAAGVAAHELTHVWQAELGCLRDADAHEFLWLTEGMATAAAWQAMGGSEAETGAAILRLGAFASRVSSLESYETRGGSDPEYALWHLAVRDLLRRSDRGPEALRAFCERARPGADWRAAFTAAFGLPPERFYAAFAAARPAYKAGTRAL